MTSFNVVSFSAISPRNVFQMLNEVLLYIFPLQLPHLYSAKCSNTKHCDRFKRQKNIFLFGKNVFHCGQINQNLSHQLQFIFIKNYSVKSLKCIYFRRQIIINYTWTKYVYFLHLGLINIFPDFYSLYVGRNYLHLTNRSA